MSEQERIRYCQIFQGIKKAQRLMLERKAKLGESVVYADSNGVPYTISAEEALRILDAKSESPGSGESPNRV